MRRFVVGVAMLGLGCAHGSNVDYAKAAEALIAVTTAVSLSALNVASGACVTTCGNGTYCDEHGMCKAYPCHDSCNPNEECVTQPIEHCVPRAAVRAPSVEVELTSSSSSGGGHLYRPAVPAVEPPSSPPGSHAEPESKSQEQR